MLRKKVRNFYKELESAQKNNIFIFTPPEDEIIEAIDDLEVRKDKGEQLPLFGLIAAIKDCIDVEGWPTTAGSPEYSYTASEDAYSVAKLKKAGALIIGKTNLDQFATGLVGTRSPYGPVSCVDNSEKISGGSSSGSAVAVASNLIDFALGTDTAGSGRVPAAFNNIVGIKTSLGLISTRGMVPACIDYDAITVFAQNIDLATKVSRIMIDYDALQPYSRRWPDNIRLGLRATKTIGIPEDKFLEVLSGEYKDAYYRSIEHAKTLGWDIKKFDIQHLLDAALLLYDGAVVAQRYASVGKFLEQNLQGSDPTVKKIILNAKDIPAYQYVENQTTLKAIRKELDVAFSDFDALLLPTTTQHPTFKQVESDPIGVNRELGTFTNFCNLLDCSAVAIPGFGSTKEKPFGIMFITNTFEDQIGVDLACEFLNETPQEIFSNQTSLVAFGHHLRGGILYYQLEELGARFVREINTIPAYELKKLDAAGKPLPQPIVVEVGIDKGVSISGEEFYLSKAALGKFLSQLPHPLLLGKVKIINNESENNNSSTKSREVIGFSCSFEKSIEAQDVSEYKSWRKYLNTLS